MIKDPGYYLIFDSFSGKTLFAGRDFERFGSPDPSHSPQGRRLVRDADAGELITEDMLFKEKGAP